jgi:hypothetical protein
VRRASRSQVEEKGKKYLVSWCLGGEKKKSTWCLCALVVKRKKELLCLCALMVTISNHMTDATIGSKNGLRTS